MTNYGGCRRRRNLNSLSEKEKGKLVSAVENLIKRGRWEHLGNIHGGPPYFCADGLENPDELARIKVNRGFCCQHDRSLLPWHRLYLVQMEDELSEHGVEYLPYWDWTEDEIPDIFDDIKAPIKEPQTPACEGGGQFTTRKAGIVIDKEELKKQVKDALVHDNYADFWKAIAAPHSELHQSVGCEMGDPATAAYDPIFYLYHGGVDMLLAFWQELQRLRGFEHDPEDENGEQVDPDDGRIITQWPSGMGPYYPFDGWGSGDLGIWENGELGKELKKLYVEGEYRNDKLWLNSRGGSHSAYDPLNYKEDLCFHYDQLIFDGQTPAEFLKKWKTILSDTDENDYSTAAAGKCRKVCKEIKGKSYCEEICTNTKPGGPPIKVYVGVVLPLNPPTGSSAFDLCQDAKCVKAGRVGTFGVEEEKHANNHPKKYLTEQDVTNVMVEQGWTQSCKMSQTCQISSCKIDSGDYNDSSESC